MHTGSYSTTSRKFQRIILPWALVPAARYTRGLYVHQRALWVGCRSRRGAGVFNTYKNFGRAGGCVGTLQWMAIAHPAPPRAYKTKLNMTMFFEHRPGTCTGHPRLMALCSRPLSARACARPPGPAGTCLRSPQSSSQLWCRNCSSAEGAGGGGDGGGGGGGGGRDVGYAALWPRPRPRLRWWWWCTIVTRGPLDIKLL